MADEFKTLRFFICTWNVAETDPVEDDQYDKLLHSDEEIDVYAIGLQEIKTGVQEAIKRFVKYDDWAKSLMAYMSKKSYFLLESISVQGVSISVFAAMKHLPHVRYIKTDVERTGVASAWGNKGGAAVSAQVYGQRVCFLNVHLAAHLHNYEERIKDLEGIYRDMDFGGNTTVQSHDLVLMFGDFNFRIDDFSREFIIETVAKKNYSVLWEKDQLKRFQKSDKLLSEYEEGVLNFDPTYKYDDGTDTYDTSEKERKPAWTDRVLWRIHPELRTDADGPPITISLVEKSFTNHMNFKQSDHKPVTCQLNLRIQDAEIKDPVLRIEPEGEWSCDRDGTIKIESFEGMIWNRKDYVGLYKAEFHDFRSYESCMYIPKLHHEDSSSSSDSDEGDNNDKSLNSPSVVRDDSNDKVKHVTFKKKLIDEPGMYRLGYYSAKMSCLVAVSEPFEVR